MRRDSYRGGRNSRRRSSSGMGIPWTWPRRQRDFVTTSICSRIECAIAVLPGTSRILFSEVDKVKCARKYSPKFSSQSQISSKTIGKILGRIVRIAEIPLEFIYKLHRIQRDIKLVNHSEEKKLSAFSPAAVQTPANHLESKKIHLDHHSQFLTQSLHPTKLPQIQRSLLPLLRFPLPKPPPPISILLSNFLKIISQIRLIFRRHLSFF